MSQPQFEVIQRLKEYGYRLTPQREIMLSVLAKNNKHLSAEEVLRRVRRTYPYLNKSVVYRNLELLTELGLVSQTNLGQGAIEFELHQHPHHHHIVCRHCHHSAEVAPELFGGLELELRKRYGFAADLDHLAIFGLCRKCQSSKKSQRGHHPHTLS